VISTPPPPQKKTPHTHTHTHTHTHDTDREAIDDRTQYGAEKNIPSAYGVIKTKIYSVIIFNTCCVGNVVCKSEKLHLSVEFINDDKFNKKQSPQTCKKF